MQNKLLMALHDKRMNVTKRSVTTFCRATGVTAVVHRGLQVIPMFRGDSRPPNEGR